MKDPPANRDAPAPSSNATSERTIPIPTPLPTGIAGWLATFAAPFLTGVPEAGRAAVLARAEALLPALRDETGQWWADYVRLRFVAEKPV